MKAISIWFALNFLKNNSLLWISRIDLFQIEILSLIGKSELSRTCYLMFKKDPLWFH